MSDLLTKYLLHADPVHRGWTPAGVMNAVTATNGLTCPRVEGGYNLYRGTSAGAITTPAGAASASAGSVRPFAWLGQEPEERYVFRLAAIGPGGVESIGNPITAVTIGEDGAAPEPVPPAPRRLSVSALAGGRFALQWEHVASPAFARAASWAIYSDAGGGTIDLDAPIATVTARITRAGAGFYGYRTAAFSHGQTVQFVVRARTAGGAEESNANAVSAIADAEGPAAHQVSDVEYGGDE